MTSIHPAAYAQKAAALARPSPNARAGLRLLMNRCLDPGALGPSDQFAPKP